MTYEEAYMQCESIEELEKMVNKDIKIALFLNTESLTLKEYQLLKNQQQRLRI